MGKGWIHITAIKDGKGWIHITAIKDGKGWIHITAIKDGERVDTHNSYKGWGIEIYTLTAIRMGKDG